MGCLFLPRVQIPVSETTLAQMSLRTGIFNFSLLPQISDVVVRNALTGFRSDWQHLKAAIPLTSDVSSDFEPTQARVNRFDYAADGSDNDEKEATAQATTSIKKPTKDSESKVRSIKFFFNQYQGTITNCWCRVFFSPFTT